MLSIKSHFTNRHNILFATVALVATAPVSVVLAQPKAPTVVPGKRLGQVYLGYTPAQVRKALGKPDKTWRLRNGLTDHIYLPKKTRMRDGEAVRDKLEVLYLKGRVMQIEATSPAFRTASGLSTSSTVGQIVGSRINWRVQVYGYERGESAWQNFYLTDQKKGLTIEFEGWQENLMRRSLPTTIIVHRPGTRAMADVGGKLVTDSTDLSVVMAE